jgi:hypothetical protein
VQQPGPELFRLLVDAVADYAIFALDARGHVLTWNEGARRLKGYEPHEIIGRHFSTFYPPEDKASGKPDGELLLADAEGRWEDEGWRLRKDGTRFWANVVITALRDPSGRLVGFAKVTRDLTERRAAEMERVRLLSREQAARAAAAAASQAVKAREEFMAIAAHELKTPLTSLLASAQLLKRVVQREEGSPLSERAVGAIKTIETQTRKANRLIEQLLDMSRSQSGQLTIQCENVDLVAIVREVVEDARARSPARTFHLRAPTGLRATVDPLRIEQVVANLIENAAKYTPEDAPIEVELATEDGDARIMVRDHGPGIPIERRGGLFGRFYRAHEDSHRSGLGLGLHISRWIADLHGGSIVVDFPSEGGTKVIVRVPLRQR